MIPFADNNKHMHTLPAAIIHPAHVPQLDKAMSCICLVENMLVVHSLMAGHGQVLVASGTVRQRTPLQCPGWTAQEHHHVQALWVGVADLEPVNIEFIVIFSSPIMWRNNVIVAGNATLA